MAAAFRDRRDLPGSCLPWPVCLGLSQAPHSVSKDTLGLLGCRHVAPTLRLPSARRSEPPSSRVGRPWALLGAHRPQGRSAASG